MIVDSPANGAKRHVHNGHFNTWNRKRTRDGIAADGKGVVALEEEVFGFWRLGGIELFEIGIVGFLFDRGESWDAG